MEEIYFDFWNKEYSDDEIIERAKEYCAKVDEAFEYLGTKKKADEKKAFQIFKEINKCLRLEHKMYLKNVYNEVPQEYKIINEYLWSIKDIMGHINNTNSYERLSSNLYDVSFYFRYYMKDKVK